MHAIRLDHVSKKFILHPERARSFYDQFLSAFHWVTGRRDNSAKRDFWALRDVSFEVQCGECISCIGSNGSGKSTTLKLMSGIIRPTTGSLTVNGRLSAMLEVGTGFHPDLTGRENVYLSGAILGLSKGEVKDSLNAIVEFADIDDFLDVPVRNYSSGMYVRLGFAVATHVQPDILLVDEVLAVGDQAFQKKCIAKIQSLRRKGVTVVFVTHNLELVRYISDRVLWLKDGEVVASGRPDLVIPKYVAYQDARLKAVQGSEKGKREKSAAYLEAVSILDGAGKPATLFQTGETLTIRLSYIALDRITHPTFGLAIFRDDGLRVNGPNTGVAKFYIEAIQGRGYVDYIISELPLLSGSYSITVGLFDESGAIAYDYADNMASFAVQPSPGTDMYGVVQLAAKWEHHPRQTE